MTRPAHLALRRFFAGVALTGVPVLPAVAQGDAAPLPNVIRPSIYAGNATAPARRERGRFMFDTEVNGTKLPMVFDTGASHVVIRAEDAARVGINPSTLRYGHTAATANGEGDVAPVTIDRLSVGPIERRNVIALVARPGMLSVNLLGQSFLARIGGYRLDGDRLILSDGPAKSP